MKYGMGKLLQKFIKHFITIQKDKVAGEAITKADVDQRQRQKNLILKGAKDMQEKIVEFIKKKTNDYKQSVNDRMAEIDKKFDELIPAIPKQEKAAIKKQVLEDVKEAKEIVADDLI